MLSVKWRQFSFCLDVLNKFSMTNVIALWDVCCLPGSWASCPEGIMRRVPCCVCWIWTVSGCEVAGLAAAVLGVTAAVGEDTQGEHKHRNWLIDWLIDRSIGFHWQCGMESVPRVLTLCLCGSCPTGHGSDGGGNRGGGGSHSWKNRDPLHNTKEKQWGAVITQFSPKSS